MPQRRYLFAAASALCFTLLCAPMVRAVNCSVRKTALSPGDIAMANRDYASAESLYVRESKADGPEGDRTHAAYIRALLRDSKIAEAEKDATAWSSSQPSNTWAMIASAEVFWREGNDQPALEIFDKVRARDICNAREHVDLATIFRMGALYATANKELTLARQLDPVDPETEISWTHLQPRSVQLN